MSIYTIYKLTNKVNGKSYIGFTKRWPHRLNEHHRASTDMLIHKAIKKYGINSFDHCILYQSADRDFTLMIMEPYFIKVYNTLNEGYNQTPGGEGNTASKSEEHKRKIGDAHIGMKRSKETCYKISESKKGKKMSEQSRKNISEGHKGLKKSKETIEKTASWHRGKKRSEETRRKMREAKRHKSVKQ